MSSLRESKSQKPTVAPPSKKQAQTVQLQSNNQFHQRQQDTQESIDSSPKMGAMQLKARQIPTAPIQRQVNNTGLPDQLKSGIEQLSGLDMSDTRVHYNSAKPAQLQAHAYAQGTDIHLAPGQEKHLAHEAWHVVQQKQGRVKATTQLKGKTPINDDAGLEREADVMGAKALQMRTDAHAPLQRKSISSNAQPVQRYSVVQDDAGTVYNKSNNGHFLVGLGYPNHELYIRDTGMIDALNNNLDASLLRFTNAGARSISFNDTAERYYKVMPIHKTQGDNAIDTDALDVGIRNTLVNNLAKKQYRTQLDATNSYNNETFDADFEAQYDKEAKTQEFTTNTGPAENVYEFKMKTEFIRKSLSQLGYTDKGDDTIERVKGEFILVYQVINRYFKGGANKTDVAQALQLFTNSFPFVSVNPLLIKVMETTGEMQNFLQHIPDTSSTHLVNKGHLNRQLAQQGRGELLLPRGCDIVAGTTMGKPTDMDTPMPFSMRFFMNSHSDDHTHFSTKIFADDTDFVTIEGFAASGLNVFDDTWEFFLHGDRLEEDDAFFQYTMSRYDFFDFKADFMRRYNDASEAERKKYGGGSTMYLGARKEMMADPARKAIFTYNQHIDAGGGRGNLRLQKEIDDARYNELKSKLYFEAERIFERIPSGIKGVEEMGYSAYVDELKLQLFNELNAGREFVIANFQRIFRSLIEMKDAYLRSGFNTIAHDYNFLNGSIRHTSTSPHAMAQDLNRACDQHLQANAGDGRQVRLAKKRIQKLEDKSTEYHMYFANNILGLDTIH